MTEDNLMTKVERGEFVEVANELEKSALEFSNSVVRERFSPMAALKYRVLLQAIGLAARQLHAAEELARRAAGR